jgi:phospholipid/cholesterol/gamma-HCH transport system ATP-binding protein
MASAPLIELKSVNMSFEDTSVFKQIDVSLFKDETLVLIGPSGQGKTVLLKMMCGLLEPTSGEVYFQGKAAHELRAAEKESLLRSIGVLFQKNALFDSLSVGDNIAFPLRETTEKTEKEIEAIVDKYLQAVGLTAAKHLFPDEISGGMQKRLGIARALALEPKIVFYDDPTAGLDPITSRTIVNLILDLKKQFGSTIVSITNDMNRAYQMANRIGMATQGEFILTGTPEETKRHADPRVQQFIRGNTKGPLTSAVEEEE